ncbi:fimbrial protein [Serratia sp. P2ACOL2]|uniref:fimbrial protein n=1 Tax=Serratia sp. P2ACOL2 TaxID=2482769 RepID=UPI000EFD83FB|nr:fimbrial protein [Serratia sp. P2ACOL2]AYO39786.1 type 1 fimbrial protein [Serratia sp. P2ACOL2]
MRRQNEAVRLPPSRHERLYRWCLAALVMMVPVVMVVGWLLIPSARAADWVLTEHGDVEGSSGQLWVHGALTESACRLDMESAYQDVNLGDVGTGRLQNVGDRGTPVAVQLHLRDCLRMSGGSQDSRTGNLTWSASQPVVSVSFIAPTDPDSPGLVQVRGAKGIGLRLLDEQLRDVRLGEPGPSQWVTPGLATLTYTIAPERTAAPLQAGAYRATVDFRLNYD